MHGIVNYKFLAEAGLVHNNASTIAATFRLRVQGNSLCLLQS